MNVRRIVSWLALFVCSSAPLGCGAPTSETEPVEADMDSVDDGIVGGVKTSIETVPWQVFLDGGCGGSILSASWILTAAHCAQLGHVGARIGAGATNRTLFATKGQVRTVVATYRHPKYVRRNGIPSFDGLLLKLDKPLTFNASVQPVRFAGPANATLFKPKTPAVASGWGRSDTEPQATLLRSVSLWIATDAEVKQTYGTAYRDEIGTMPSTRGPCYGDSGGPLYVIPKDKKPLLVGVASHGRGGCANAPIMYARVSVLSDWIHKTTGLPVGR
jgi:trypsin